MDKQTQDVVEVDRSNLDFPPIINSVKYIPKEKIIELRKKNLSCGQIAKILGCSRANIIQRIKRISNEMELTESHIKNRSFIFAMKERQACQAMTPAKFLKANLYQLDDCVERFHKMGRLEEGKSTQNIFYADMIKAKQIIDQEIRELEVTDNMSSNEGKTGI